MLVTLFLKALGEVWDLLNNYMIPAVVIEKKSLRDTVPKLKALRSNVPATLMGVFGIDFVGSVALGFILPFYIFSLILVGSSIAAVNSANARPN